MESSRFPVRLAFKSCLYGNRKCLPFPRTLQPNGKRHNLRSIYEYIGFLILSHTWPILIYAMPNDSDGLRKSSAGKNNRTAMRNGVRLDIDPKIHCHYRLTERCSLMVELQIGAEILRWYCQAVLPIYHQSRTWERLPFCNSKRRRGYLKVPNSKESTKPVVIHSKYQLKWIESLEGEKKDYRQVAFGNTCQTRLSITLLPFYPSKTESAM